MEIPTLEECKRILTDIDENGQKYVLSKEQKLELMRIECGGNDVDCKVTASDALNYYFYEYDEEKIRNRDNWYSDKDTPDYIYENRGLYLMINDGFLASPACVSWNDYDRGFLRMIMPKNLEYFIQNIDSAANRVTYLKYFKSIYKAVLPANSKEGLPIINRLLTDAQVKLKQEQDAEKERKKQEKQAKPKPEYILSLDEIVAYANEEAGENVGAIKAMLRYFKEEKDGWDNKTVKSIIQSIGKKSENNTTINVQSGAAFNDIHDNTNPTIH